MEQQGSWSRAATRSAAAGLFATMLAGLAAAGGPTFEVVNGQFGTGSAGTGYFDLVPGEDSILKLAGSPGEIGLVAISLTPPSPTPLIIAGVPVAVDLQSIVFVGPPMVFGADGTAAMVVPIPTSLPLDITIHLVLDGHFLTH